MSEQRGKIRAVIDTNIIISAFLKPDGICSAIIQAITEEKFELVFSDEIVDEYIEVLIRKGINLKLIRDLNKLLSEKSLKTKGLYKVERSEDIKDNMFLACALEGKADYLVTSDHHLRNIKYYHGVQIVSVEQFLKLVTVDELKED